MKIDYVCQKFSYFAKISCTNNIENGTKEKWGVAESLRANPIFCSVFLCWTCLLLFSFVDRRVLVWWSEATPLVYDKHTPKCQIIFFH